MTPPADNPASASERQLIDAARAEAGLGSFGPTSPTPPPPPRGPVDYSPVGGRASGLSPEQLQRVDDLFAEGLHIPEHQRTEWLLRACSGDELVRREVSELLHPARLRAGIGGMRSGVPNFSMPLADSFPGYQIVREVRRGGQGMVYQAIQKTTRRKVALKVMREGHFGDPREKARFEREVQILAQLSHPGIVAIHDSGTTPSGQFYYVMDYISGEPLDRFIERGEQPVDDTLNLFIKICDAVNAAHLKGVIHRDLKPSNILLDNAGEPHILDFGLAKVATGEVTAESTPQVMTMTGQFMGSLPWASPEQAEGRPEKIDIRTDVYSLGVVLYQMLAGRFPYEIVGNMRDVMDRIMTADPARPSTFRREVNHEVETIVLKALAKQRERRYQTAGELARDIRHYLAGEPIEAKRDSIGYVLTKQLRRYKLPVAMMGAMVALVTIGFVVSTSLWRSAAQARNIAQQASTKAAFELDKADDAIGFLRKMLSTSVSGDHDITVRQALDTTAAKLDQGTGKPNQPLIEVKIRLTFVETYRALGLADVAERQARAALELAGATPSMERADCLSWLCLLRQDRFLYDEAEDFARQACEMYPVVLHPGDKHYVDVFESQNNLANILLAQGKNEAAEKLSVEALPRKTAELEECRKKGSMLPKDIDRQIGFSLSTIAKARQELHRWDEADRSFQQALENFRRAADGKPDFEVARCLQHRADLRFDQGRLNEAADDLQESLTILRAVRLNPNDPSIAGTLELLGEVMLAQGHAAEAEATLKQSFQMRQANPQPQPWLIPLGRLLLGNAELAQGLGDPSRLAAAEEDLAAGYRPVQELRSPAPVMKRAARTIERVAALYERQGNQELAATWRSRRKKP